MYIYYHSGNKIEQMKHYLHEEPSSVCGWDCRGKGVKTNTSRLRSLLLFLPREPMSCPREGRPRASWSQDLYWDPHRARFPEASGMVNAIREIPSIKPK